MAIAGLSTLGMIFCYGTGATKPTSSGLTELTRINNIGGISLNVESIDASAITDAITRRIAGRADTDETLNVTVNVTSATITEWSLRCGSNFIIRHSLRHGGSRQPRRQRFRSRKSARTNFLQSRCSSLSMSTSDSTQRLNWRLN